ncbi:MAG: hypothetical protein AAGD14_04860, partial [Planctomycetota bacterium]
MRVLILCFATFAAGTLAGSILFSEDGGAARMRGRDAGTERTREYRPSPVATRDATDFESGARASGPDDRAREADVRALTRRANSSIGDVTQGEIAAAMLQGTGKLNGSVRDPEGNAVAGVIITAVPDTRPFELTARSRESRLRSHEDRQLGDVAQSAIENELWRRFSRRTATTDANGRYEMSGLTDTRHRLTAFHPKYDVQPLNQRGRVQPDAVVDFGAKPIAEIRVQVKQPDGTLAEHAWLRWEGAHGRGQEAWLREQGTVRLPLGSCKVKAELWLPEPMESEEVEREILASEGQEPIVLELKARRVLTARLAMPEGYSVPQRVQYRMRKVEGGEVEPESLLADQSNRHARVPTPGRAHWFDLEPGRYLVAAFTDQRRLLGSAVAEVKEGPSEVELSVEEPDAGSFVMVKLLGPDGGPVPGNVSFRVVNTVQNRSRTTRVDAMQRDEAWLVFLDRVPGRKDGGRAQMRVGTRDYGGAVEEFNLRGGGTISFKFDKPGRIQFEIDGYNGSGVEGSLYVALRGKLGADSWNLVAPDGTARSSGVQPGNYDLYLYVRSKGRNWPIYKKPMVLRPGEDDLRLAVPTL